MSKMIFHKGRQVDLGWATRFTTLCGRMAARCKDGMNIADSDEQVTCKFCLAKMATQAEAIFRPLLETRGSNDR